MNRMMIAAFICVSLLASSFAQSTYMTPPEPIASMMESTAAPWFRLAPDNKHALLMHRSTMPSIAEVAVDAVEVAGLRIHPQTNGGVGESEAVGLSLLNLKTNRTQQLLPDDRDWRIALARWSSDSQKLAFINTTENGIELWLRDLDSKEPRLLVTHLNMALTTPFQWAPDGESIFVLRVPDDRGATPKDGVPTGPMVEQSEGQVAAVRTYQNLLKTELDEALFEYYLQGELLLLSLEDESVQVLEKGMISDFNVSPDGHWLMTETLHRPWSRQVPQWRFPRRLAVRELATGHEIEILDSPLHDAISISYDSVQPGPRWIRWRSDRPSTLLWYEALDGGDADSTCSERDAVVQLDAPFSGNPQELARLEFRASRLYWGQDDVALLYERWHRDRLERIWLLDPSTGKRSLFFERASDDAYADPGRPQFHLGTYNRWVLKFSESGEDLFWAGRGASERGVFPFVDRWNLNTGARERIWESRDPYYERLEELLDNKGDRFVISRQSVEDPPNYFLLEKPKRRREFPRHSSDFRVKALTQNPDPAPELAGLRKEVLRYQRADGVDLSGTLYLPPGYDATRDGPLPTLLWVYPREYRDRKSAGRVTASETTFSRPRGSSVLYLLTQGYAIFAGPSMPILGENGEEPNDTYIEQLLLGAEAAVDCLVERGVSDPSRMAVGGHSYGAFTAANLLAHSDIFRTAICRSGAYNRSLTPFSFQGEERNFWEADGAYQKMSPFMQADLIDEPVLLIHGMEDANSGTYPMQSERFYAALKGLGVTARLVRLPGEGHGYDAKESAGHVLWEMCNWLDRYLDEVEDETVN